MEKPYRLRKKLVKTGNSTYLLIPAGSLAGWSKLVKVKKVTDVIMEVYQHKIVVFPYK